ncbi:InlB B-repeat-containing protein [Paenibacillus sp. IHB B 3415]|uniref:InlB B-repeat-containing protein n=1 Tax=Paenibacillus sp. IHB B 3415 TaxID=867080 RepID=UPI0013649EE6|nr:InlB B-repeat-containing protein [Paenibacillus sp. IHB B 3415]
MALETDSFKDLSGDLLVEEGDIQYLSSLDDTGTMQMKVAGSKVEVELEDIKVNIGTSLKHFKGKSGVRASIEIGAEVSIEIDDDNEIKIKLKGVFEQELSVDISASGEIFWKKIWFIPYPSDFTINANIDVFTYTAVQFDANIGLFEQEEEPDWNSDSVENIAKQLKKIMEEAEELDDGEINEISNSLPDLYQAMLENDNDWVDIVEQNLLKVSFRVAAGLVEVTFRADFVVSAKVNVSLGIIYTYENGQRYSYYIRLLAGSVGNSKATLVPEKYDFTFYAMGELGLRAGVRLEVAVGALSTSLNSIGVQVEMGGYIKLWGFFYYQYSQTQGKASSSNAAGALNVEIGLYLDIKVIAQAFKGTFSVVPFSTSYEFPLLTIGSRYVVIDFAYDQDDVQDVRLKGNDYIFPLDDYLLEMSYMDLHEGEVENQVYHDVSQYFDITFSNSNFYYDPLKRRVLVGNFEPTGVDTVMTIAWRSPFASFNSEPISRKINLHYDDLRSSYSVNLLSYDQVITPPSLSKIITRIWGEYNSDIPKQPDPVRVGYNFTGWYDDVNSVAPVAIPAKMPANTILLYAKWSPKTDTPYLVESYTQNIYTGQYTLHSAERYRGTTDSVAEYEPIDIWGHLTPKKQEVKINADGTTLLRYYYERGNTALTFSYDYLSQLGLPFGVSPEVREYRPGAMLDPPYPVLPGLKFVEWENIDATVPLEAKTYQAIFEVGNFDLKVNYYAREDWDSEFTKLGSEIVSVPAWSTFDASKEDLLDKTEYMLQTDVDVIPNKSPSTIYVNDDNLTLNLYYHKLYDATFDLNGGSLTEQDISGGGGSMVDGKYVIYTAQGYLYGRPNPPTREGFEFMGWEGWAADDSQIKREMPAHDVTYKAIWKAKYTVEHYIKGVGIDDDYTLYTTTEHLGLENETVTGAVYDIEGFTFESGSSLNVQTGTVKDDGSLVLKMYYDRNVYTAKFIGTDPDTGVQEVLSEETYRYGAEFSIPSRTTYAYRKVLGWRAVDGGPELPPYYVSYPMPAQNVTYEIILGDYADDGGGGFPGWPF